ncbi:MAG TPA: thioredoxin family protein [Drouetiella sp.]|jgi:thioredoxin 1
MNSADASTKLCAHCNMSDFTDFSTCRYCGKKYGTTPPPPPKTYLTEKALAVCTAAIVMFGIVHHERAKAESVRRTTLTEIRREISVSHRPRVLEFGADWCGACRAYGPTIEAARARYQNIDFVRYDVDNPSTANLALGLGVSAIPVTCFIDRNGNLVSQEVGALSDDYLNEKLKTIL